MDWCERHRWYIVDVLDLVVVDVGPRRLAVMSALRGILGLSPSEAKALVDGGVPIVLADVSVLGIDEAELVLCEAGATTERVVRSYCEQRLPGDPVDDGAIAWA